MKELKIWARRYLVHSPLFKSPLFQHPHNQELMRINPQLLSAYTLSMFKKYHYDHRKVLSVLDDYYPQQHHYSVEVVKDLLKHRHYSDDLEGKYRNLVFKLFQKNINLQQFKQLAELYVKLKQEDKLRQFDDFVLDQCFYLINHLAIFCELGYSAAIQAVDTQSIKMLEKILEKTFLIGIYGLYVILNRLKEKFAQHPELQPYLAWIQPKADFKKILKENPHCRKFLLRQSLSYILWLLRVKQFGTVVIKYTKQNYIYSSYLQNSIQTVGALLELFEEDHHLSVHQLLVLNEAVYEVQNILQISMLFEDIKRNIALEMLLIRMKTEINNELINHDKQHRTQLEHFAWLQNVNMFPLDYTSYTTRTYLKAKIQNLLNHPHLAILLNNRQLNTLVELSKKIDQFPLTQKLYEKIRHLKGHHNQENNLVAMLEEYYFKGTKMKQYKMEITDIYELKRIKNILQELKIKQHPCPQLTAEERNILISLEEELANEEEDSEPRAELKPLFNVFLR